jgi:hypothetical protein
VAFEDVDVDHVAVTPGGVLAVETKWVGNRTVVRWLDHCVWQAGNRAHKIRSLLRSRGRPDLPVVPVLVVWGPGGRALEGPVERAEVVVLPGLAADALLTRWGTGRVTVADARQVETELLNFIAMREQHELSRRAGRRRSPALRRRAGPDPDRAGRAAPAAVSRPTRPA